MLNLKK